MQTVYAGQIVVAGTGKPVRCCSVLMVRKSGAVVCTGCDELLAVLPVQGEYRQGYTTIDESEEERNADN